MVPRTFAVATALALVPLTALAEDAAPVPQTPSAAPTTGVDERGRTYRVVTLTEAESLALEVGELGPVGYTLGGLASIYPGLGLGQLIQGRWRSSGWRFTIGEVASIAVATGGLVAALSCGENGSVGQCSSPVPVAAIGVGVAGVVVFRVWEIVDAWGGGAEHQDDYERATQKIAAARARASSRFLVVPTYDRGTPGVVAAFTF